ncbi:KpsF/GutQ family sugar-phosphate isomerase [Candidatus Fermentibacterales bacterium]|nr:KpsF/GutQ family sugar-phosphate isomerase [Candidatus Fermentibacterales bacterium]
MATSISPRDEARRVLATEARWIEELVPMIGESFDRAVDVLASARGKIVVCGMGKSGHVARKIAGTMTGTGSPAYFLHPAEGAHGELGIVARGDVALILSKSGETPEVAAILPTLRRLEIPVVAVTCVQDSLLGRAADVTLLLPDLPEACPHDLTPTASTTAMMALGDALAMSMLRMKDFSPEDFAEVHPGGSLGRKLLLKVGDLMAGPPLPLLGPASPLSEAIVSMTAHRGVCLMCGGESGTGPLEGIFVYGDLGRLMKNRVDVLELTLEEVAIREPATAFEEELASVALSRMETLGVTCLVVVDGAGRPTGLLYLHDVMRAGVR